RPRRHRRGGDGRTRHRRDRPAGAEPVSVRGGDREGRLQPGRGGGEHRHRRAGHAALGGEELRARGGRPAPAQHGGLAEELAATAGPLCAATRLPLSGAAVNRVARYGAAIANCLSSIGEPTEGVPARSAFPAQLHAGYVKVMDLRYGENPHQAAAFYRDPEPVPGTLATFTQLQGKELSYNNLADADAAWECVRQFDAPACVIVKHANPCGVAVASGCGDAYERAYATDPTSAFGGILAFNTRLDGATVKS